MSAVKTMHVKRLADDVAMVINVSDFDEELYEESDPPEPAPVAEPDESSDEDNLFLISAKRGDATFYWGEKDWVESRDDARIYETQNGAEQSAKLTGAIKKALEKGEITDVTVEVV